MLFRDVVVSVTVVLAADVSGHVCRETSSIAMSLLMLAPLVAMKSIWNGS